MPVSSLGRLLAATLLIGASGILGCAPDGTGTIDLKKTAGPSAHGAERPREFGKGDLEER